MTPCARVRTQQRLRNHLAYSSKEIQTRRIPASRRAVMRLLPSLQRVRYPPRSIFFIPSVARRRGLAQIRDYHPESRVGQVAGVLFLGRHNLRSNPNKPLMWSLRHRGSLRMVAMRSRVKVIMVQRRIMEVCSKICMAWRGARINHAKESKPLILWMGSSSRPNADTSLWLGIVDWGNG